MLMLIVEQDLELNFVVDIVCEIKKEELGAKIGWLSRIFSYLVCCKTC